MQITSRSQKKEKEIEKEREGFKRACVRKDGYEQRSEGHGNIKGFEFNESGMKLRKCPGV